MFSGLAQFLEHLQHGGCGVYPTDTVPGLGCLPQHVEQLYRYKNRAQDKPIIILAADLDQVRNLCAHWDEAWDPVVARYWPGALTLVLPAADSVPQILQQEGMVGLRIPNHPAARQLLAESGPLATTSVNRSGAPPLIDPIEIVQYFPTLPLLSADYHNLGCPSTVARWRGGAWEILRQGAITLC